MLVSYTICNSTIGTVYKPILTENIESETPGMLFCKKLFLTDMRGKFNLPLSILLLATLLASLVLTACGEQKPVASNSPGPILSPASSTPNSVNSPLATPALIATPVSTSTPVPSPTPVPQPNSLLLGNEDDPWGEITRYQELLNTVLQEVKLSATTLSDVKKLFAATPNLIKSPGSPNLYYLKLSPRLEQLYKSGSVDYIKSLEGGIRGIVRDPSTGKIVGQASLIGVGASLTNPATATALVVALLGAISYELFIDQINKQFELVNKKLDDIKDFLQDKERSLLQGNIRYIDGIRNALNQQNLALTEIDRYRNQLENVEREILQSNELFKTQVSKAADKFNQVDLKDKNFFFFRDEDKVRELDRLINEFKQNSNSYLTALLIRGLGAQLSCALPESRQTALQRIEDSSKELDGWLETQQKFFDQVDKRSGAMDGIFADSKTPARFKETAKTGKETAQKAYDQIKSSFTDTIQKVKAQTQSPTQPLVLVVELDDQGAVKKVSKQVTI